MFIISSAASSVFLHLKKDSETLLVHGFISVETASNSLKSDKSLLRNKTEVKTE